MTEDINYVSFGNKWRLDHAFSLPSSPFLLLPPSSSQTPFPAPFPFSSPCICFCCSKVCRERGAYDVCPPWLRCRECGGDAWQAGRGGGGRPASRCSLGRSSCISVLPESLRISLFACFSRWAFRRPLFVRIS